jgi:hypothetical protein
MRRRCTWAGIGILSFVIALTSSPALSQFVCTTTPSDINCTNSGTAPTAFTKDAAGANQNDTVSNSGTASGFTSATTGGGNATATNSGSNSNVFSATTSQGGNAVATNSGSNVGGFFAQTGIAGNATAINTGSDTGVGHAFADVVAVTLVNGDATAINSGTIGDANAGNFSFLEARTQIAGNATATNSGSSAGGVVAEVLGTRQCECKQFRHYRRQCRGRDVRWRQCHGNQFRQRCRRCGGNHGWRQRHRD